MKWLVVAAMVLAFWISQAQAQQYWYYCDASHTYYPYVTTCQDAWRKVVPSSSPQPIAPPAIVPQKQEAPIGMPTPLTAQQAVPAPQSPLQPKTETPKVPDVVGNEEAFIVAVQEAKSSFGVAQNDMARGGIRATRRNRICQALTGRQVNGWIGKISELSSNGDGWGVLNITIADRITVKTWNNKLSDSGYDTLLIPDTDLFKEVAAMSEGDFVTFAGTFFESDADCVKEASLTLTGSMTDPEFIFRFSAVRKK